MDLERICKELPFPLSDIQATLNTVIQKHDEFIIRELSNPEVRTFKKTVNTRNGKKIKQKNKHNLDPKLKDIPLFTGDITEDQKLELFIATCRGETLRPASHDKDLKCRLMHYQNPYLKIGPFRLEEMNLQPYVAILRGFFSEAETNLYIEAAKGNMFRSMHTANRGHEVGMAATLLRTSKQIWLGETYQDDSDKIFSEKAEKITWRIRNATFTNPFNWNGGEMYQVANYGIGGQYSKHYDSVGEGGPVSEGFEDSGPRIQTVMAYLSDVEAGGATAFPLLGLAVWPKKGDAITWYNLHRNGAQDKLTSHGGCPVIKGSKWITNKWIRWYHQMANYPCTVNVFDETRLQPYSNDIKSFLPHGRSLLYKNHLAEDNSNLNVGRTSDVKLKSFSVT